MHILIWVFQVAQRSKNLPGNAGDMGSIPGLGRSPGEGNGNSLQYSCLENSIDRGALQATTSGLSISGASLVVQMVKNPPAMWETRVRCLSREDPLEKEMATHSSTLPWKIPWMEEPGRLQSRGFQRVGQD